MDRVVRDKKQKPYEIINMPHYVGTRRGSHSFIFIHIVSINRESYSTLFYRCLHTNHLPSLPLIWTKFEDSHHNAMIITPPFFKEQNNLLYFTYNTRTNEKFLPHRVNNPPPPYPWLTTLKIVKGMRVLFGTKATVYGKQSGSYGLQQIYTQPSPINPAKKT